MSRQVLEWCALNQGKVAAVALELGLLESGERYGDWKASDPGAYDRACVEAFGRGP